VAAIPSPLALDRSIDVQSQQQHAAQYVVDFGRCGLFLLLFPSKLMTIG